MMRGICLQPVSSLIVLMPFENMYYDSIIKYLCFDISFYAKCYPTFPYIDCGGLSGLETSESHTKFEYDKAGRERRRLWGKEKTSLSNSTGGRFTYFPLMLNYRIRLQNYQRGCYNRPH